jgi:hypothetical protein
VCKALQNLGAYNIAIHWAVTYAPEGQEFVWKSSIASFKEL